MYVIVEEHICEVQLHLRSFYSLKDGQHEVYKWSRTLNVTADMTPEHLLKNMEPAVLQLMTRLAREDWFSTKFTLHSLLVASGDYKEAQELLLQVSILSEWRELLRFAFPNTACLPPNNQGNSLWCGRTSFFTRYLALNEPPPSAGSWSR